MPRHADASDGDPSSDQPADQPLQADGCRAGDLWWLLLEVANLSRRLTERQLAPIHTTPDQIHALRVLALHGSMTVGELAAALGLEQNSGSQLVERLTQRGLVTRGRAPRDRRQSLVSVSAAGQALLDAGEPDAAALAAELFSELPPESIAQSITLLRAIRANAGRRVLRRVQIADGEGGGQLTVRRLAHHAARVLHEAPGG
ncbi:MAG TPA: MarR family winged helix-turn-helix transcriptional regulator [Dehalococcoidia bacterium]|nr:MarR family winged helix-turn-helix transcriptional regulator [Dehalococcoidia bacterium]